MIYFFLFTTPGCQLVVQGISHFSRQTIQVDQVTGHLGKKVHLEGVRVQSEKATLHLEQIQLDLQLRKLLAGKIHVHRLLVSGIDLAVAPDKEDGPDTPSSFTLPDINVPFSLVIDSLQLQDAVLAARDSGELFTQIDQFQATVQVKGHTLFLQSLFLQSPLYTGSGEASLKMQKVWPVQLTGDWQVAPPGCSQIKGRVEISGSVTEPIFSLSVRSPQKMTLHGSMQDIFMSPTFAFSGSATALDPSLFCSSSPKLAIDTSFAADGRPEKYQVRVQVLVHHEQYGQLEGTVQASGNMQGIALQHAQINHNTSVASASGKLDWQDMFWWDVNIHAEGFNPADYSLAGEGRISGNVHTSGKWGEKDQTVMVELTELAGMYNGLEVTGKGRGDWQDGRFALSELLIRNGGNSITAQGHIADRYDLAVEGTIPELGAFFPGLAGNVHLKVKLTGALGAPSLQVQAGVQQFSGYQVSFNALTGHGHVGLYGENQFEVAGVLDGLQVKEQSIHQFRFKADGAKADHQISGFVQSNLGHADFAATGGLHGNLLWQGTLDSFTLQHPDYVSWSLSRHAAITLSSNQVKVAPLCFDGANSNICFEGSWQEDNLWQVAIPSAHLELAELGAVLPEPATGLVEGNVLAQGDGATLKDFSGSLYAYELDIPFQDQLRKQEGLGGSGQVQFSLENQDMHMELAFEESMGGQLKGHCVLSPLSDLQDPFSSALLDGTFELHSGDIGWLENLYSDMLVSGELLAQVAITGQLKSPVLKADVGLIDGEVQFPLLGSGLSHIQAQIIRTADGTLDYTAFTRSGAGFARGAGKISYLDNGWHGKAYILGSNLELMHKNGLHLWGNPDLEVVFSQHGGHLSGTMGIPKAEIQPEDSIKSETVSGDVVFVDVTQPDQAWPFTYDISLQLGEEVIVEGYGFKGYLDGELQLTEPERGGMVLGTGLFNVRDGVFAFRGSQMKVGQGRIIFNGGPVNNPELDIELRKEVEPQNLGDEPVTVGVDISGSALDYQVDLYATPAMEDKEILTYILFDRSTEQDGEDTSNTLILSALESLGFDQTSTLISEVTEVLPLSLSDVQFSGNFDGNDSSIGLRKKMTDDLSIHYDFNLFKSAGRFRVVYQLVRGFSMELINSVEANGIRLLYSFER